MAVPKASVVAAQVPPALLDGVPWLKDLAPDVLTQLHTEARYAGYLHRQEADIRSFCEAHLTGYKRPKVVVFTEALPKTPVGKILRRELRDKK